jgi:hypothetical protein
VIARDMGTPRSLESQINFLFEFDERIFKLSKSIDQLELDTVSRQNFKELEEISGVNTELTLFLVQDFFL